MSPRDLVYVGHMLDMARKIERPWCHVLKAHRRFTSCQMVTTIRAVLSLLLVLLLSGLPVAAQDSLKLRLWYAPFGAQFDRDCPNLLKTQIEPEWRQEAIRRTGEFQAAWDSYGVQFLQAATTEIGAPFPYREMQATLTVCPGVISMSAPLLLQIGPYLASTPGPRKLPMWMFALGTFHELMHHYVQGVQGESRLRQKYSGEPLVTLNHLPVMALEKLALSKLQTTAELQLLDTDYRTTNWPPAYKRAWEIVNNVEGSDAFIAELKRFATPQR